MMEQHWHELAWNLLTEVRRGFNWEGQGASPRSQKVADPSIWGAQQWGPNRASRIILWQIRTKFGFAWSYELPPCSSSSYRLLLLPPSSRLMFFSSFQKWPKIWVHLSSLPINRGLWWGFLPCTVEINWNSWACCISRLLHVSWIWRPGNTFSLLFIVFSQASHLFWAHEVEIGCWWRLRPTWRRAPAARPPCWSDHRGSPTSTSCSSDCRAGRPARLHREKGGY